MTRRRAMRIALMGWALIAGIGATVGAVAGILDDRHQA